MPDPAPSDLADVLLKRQGFLRSLENRPQTKPELVESLDVPRSTLDDVMRELEDADLVEYDDGTWRLTLLGRYATEHHASYLDGLESIAEAAPLVRDLHRETPVGRRFLIDADVHVATEPVPDEVLQVCFDAIESATLVRGVTPLALAGYAEPFYRHATSGTDARVEIILPIETFERLRALHPDGTERVMADGTVELYQGDVPFGFTVWMSDEQHAGLIVYADRGVRGIMVNDTDEALAWATELYDRVRRDAEPISYRRSIGGSPRP